MEQKELNYLISEKIRIDKQLLVVYGKDLTEPILNAIKIADRVEQIWEEVKDKEFPHSMFQNCRDCGDYMQGTKDVLADIRGDNNDGV